MYINDCGLYTIANAAVPALESNKESCKGNAIQCNDNLVQTSILLLKEVDPGIYSRRRKSL